MSGKSLWTELRRRGVVGAIATYVVVAAGTLQIADVVSHGLDLPSWTMKLVIWLSVAGLPIVGAVSWFYDLTKNGLVRTELPKDREGPSPALVPLPTPTTPSSPQPTARVPLDAHALSPSSAPLAGRYRIEREIGSGGMGRVLAAHDEKLGRRVAIKVLTGAHDVGRLARFSQEARTAGALEHPNVLAVYDLGDHDGSPFLVTELLDGATLREVIKKGPVEPDAARKISLQLARGLQAAHARGVIHRDLKPENLFLTRDGRLKILDFGLAKLTDPNSGSAPPAVGLTATGAIFGTPGYLAPEQAKGLSSDARSDIFAVGAVLYELLSGSRAFPGGSLVEAGHAALTQEPPPLPRVPPALLRVVQKCIAKDPAQRFQNGGELVAALEHLDVARAPQLPDGPTWRERWRGMPRWFRVAFWGIVVLSVWSGLNRLSKHSSSSRGRARGEASDVRVIEGPQGTRVVIPPLPALPPMAPIARVPPVPPMGSRGQPPAAPEPPGQAESDDEDAKQEQEDAKKEQDQAAKEVDEAMKSIPNVAGVDVKQLREQIRAAMASGREAHTAGLSGTLNGAHALITARQYPKAETMLRREIARSPDEIHPRLFLFALQRLNGASDQAVTELRPFVKEADDEDWPMPIANFYLGDATEEKLFADAADEDDAKKRESQICEASYYAGLFYSSANPPDLARARAFFQRAAASQANDVERGFGAEDLERIDRGQIAPHPDPHPNPQTTAHSKRTKVSKTSKSEESKSVESE